MEEKKKIGGEEEDGLQDMTWQHVSTVGCIRLHMERFGNLGRGEGWFVNISSGGCGSPTEEH